MTRNFRITLALALALTGSGWSLGSQPSAQQRVSAPARETKSVYQGEAAEQFLKKARITRVSDIPKGVTQPQRVTLELDGVTRTATFKSIDLDKPGATQMADGTTSLSFQDTWRTEIAAYEVDKIIGLGLVPATVERSIRGQVGSLQWWVQSKMSEAERITQAIRPTDLDTFSKAMHTMRLFDELIYNVDRHMNNVLVTEDFDLRLIDHSRAFRPFEELRRPESLARFSRALLAGMEKLEFNDLKRRLNRYLRDGQIEAMLTRRDAIFALVKARVARDGEDAVLY
jgi:hypothetical protein